MDLRDGNLHPLQLGQVLLGHARPAQHLHLFVPNLFQLVDLLNLLLPDPVGLMGPCLLLPQALLLDGFDLFHKLLAVLLSLEGLLILGGLLSGGSLALILHHLGVAVFLSSGLLRVREALHAHLLLAHARELGHVSLVLGRLCSGIIAALFLLRLQVAHQAPVPLRVCVVLCLLLHVPDAHRFLFQARLASGLVGLALFLLQILLP
mmetsp:Transcript_85813/g.207900  ORF Transcript_85813/g.207900 Transcript_85813/m.207900 type:complete len:206 (+) Transcript_85813:321-938(+)